MMKKNILIVEGESLIAMEIESYLLSLNYKVVAVASTEKRAIKEALNNNIDLILMDIALEKGNGIDASISILQHKPNISIIFVSSYMDEDTIRRALRVNPKAYLLKPFSHKELEIAIKIALKSINFIHTEERGDVYLDDEFSFDSKTLELFCCGEVVHLTKKERILFQLFLERKNRLVSIADIEYTLWENKPNSGTRRRSLISRLRAKLNHKFITTFSSEGYIFKTI